MLDFTLVSVRFFAIAIAVSLPWLCNLIKSSAQSTYTYYLKNVKRKSAGDINTLSGTHETAAALAELIRHDGAGAWPPKSNHDYEIWPAPLQSYRTVYTELKDQLAVSPPSLDDEANAKRIQRFRCRLRKLLSERVDLTLVMDVLESSSAEHEEAVSREIFNAFYSCVAWCRHAYRWGIVPVVRVAQLQDVVDLPVELIEPWNCLQRRVGCTSQSGNVMSSLILNVDADGRHAFKANSGLSASIVSAEEEFARIFRDMEAKALPIYVDMVQSITSFSRGDWAMCASHLANITQALRPVLSIYYDRLHNQNIPRALWLSHVQGFLAWGAGFNDETTGRFVRHDGLSGNQILLFQALDAFLGMEPYLSSESLEQNVPIRQRQFCEKLLKHSIRRKVDALDDVDDAAQIWREFDAILKRLRLFRTAHRTRSMTYLTQSAPERLPMTAGKSMLSANLDQSLKVLDEFMVGRLKETH